MKPSPRRLAELSLVAFGHDDDLGAALRCGVQHVCRRRQPARGRFGKPLGHEKLANRHAFENPRDARVMVEVGMRDDDRIERGETVRREGRKDDTIRDARCRTRACVEEDARAAALDEIRRPVADGEHGDAKRDGGGAASVRMRARGRRYAERAVPREAEEKRQPRARQGESRAPSPRRS